ncbi:MAG: hypothetical protein KGK07_03315 [Chloroflexota bacterium]|nr:hypothetical protein [Chloroflexota bacterium]
MRLRKNLSAKLGALAASLLALGATLVLVQRNPPPAANATTTTSAPPPAYADGNGADASQSYYTQAPPVDTRTSVS